jgi:hypothetical protein
MMTDTKIGLILKNLAKSRELQTGTIRVQRQIVSDTEYGQKQQGGGGGHRVQVHSSLQFFDFAHHILDRSGLISQSQLIQVNIFLLRL